MSELLLAVVLEKQMADLKVALLVAMTAVYSAQSMVGMLADCLVE